MGNGSLKRVTDRHGSGKADSVSAIGANNLPLNVDARNKVLLIAPMTGADFPLSRDDIAVNPMVKD
jgi:hypothetical protein